MESEQGIVVERLDAVCRLTLNRPAQKNAFTAQMALDIPARLQEQIDDGVRAVILTGADGAFCSGAALGAGPGDGKPIDAGEHMDRFYNPMARFLADMPVPLVTAVEGAAAGAGASLALGGDIIVAGRSAYFFLSFARIGLVPDCGGAWLIARAAGRVRALQMALLAEKMPAEEALGAGLVTEVVDDDAVQARALELAERLAAMPPRTLAEIRSLVRTAISSDFDTVLDAERDAQARLTRTRDFREGMAAFAEKRNPVFTGE
jgi:2-(1,2-epoxy-1,2-dihydrophenyl)acetyl-CoA isomerase